MPKTTKKNQAQQTTTKTPEEQLSTHLGKDVEYVPSSCKIPCDYGMDAFLPYWERKDGEVFYGIDVYMVCSIAGSGSIWICRVSDKDNKKSGPLEPNVDIFFSRKDAEKKINAFKKADDLKKISKWYRRDIENVGN